MTTPNNTVAGLAANVIEQGWRDSFSTNNPFCPCDLKSFTKAVRWAERALASHAPSAPVVDDAMVRAIACALAREDGYDPDDRRGGLYDLRWSCGSPPEPLGDAWAMDYLPKAERIAAALSGVSAPPSVAGDAGELLRLAKGLEETYRRLSDKPLGDFTEWTMRAAECKRAAALIRRLATAEQPDDRLADTQRAIIEAAERRGYDRAMAEQPGSAVQGEELPLLPPESPEMQPRYPGDAAIAKAFRVVSTRYATDDLCHFAGEIERLARQLAAESTPPPAPATDHIVDANKKAEARGVEGMVLVPREPTEAMIAAGNGRWAHPVNYPIDVYRAMLAAAPEPVRVDERAKDRADAAVALLRECEDAVFGKELWERIRAFLSEQAGERENGNG